MGGTNPSLLEAMASGALICAHHNIFNESILGEDAFYFESAGQVARLMRDEAKPVHKEKVEANIRKIETIYSWPVIVDQYLYHFQDVLNKRYFAPAKAGKSSK